MREKMFFCNDNLERREEMFPMMKNERLPMPHPEEYVLPMPHPEEFRPVMPHIEEHRPPMPHMEEHRPPMPHVEEHRPPMLHMEERRPPMPPHRRNAIIVDFDEKNAQAMYEMFGDEDTAKAAMSIIHDAPPEIKILVMQLLKLIGVEVKIYGSRLHRQPMMARWSSPILGQKVTEAYMDTYGEDGETYVEMLESAPYDMTVISRIITYLQQKKGETYGCNKDM